MPEQPKSLDASTIRAICVEANADPGTVRDELKRPGKIHNMARKRVREALWARGYVVSQVTAEES